MQAQVIVQVLHDIRSSKTASITRQYPDSVRAVQNLEDYLQHLRGEGYLAASADTLLWHADTMEAWIWRGLRYRWAKLKLGQSTQSWISLPDIKWRQYEGHALSPGSIVQIEETVLHDLENRGYPFATVWLDSIQIDVSSVSTTLQINPGELILFDTIAIHGSANIQVQYLKRYLGIRYDSPYQEQQIQVLGKRLDGLAFIEQEKPYTVQFSKNKARIDLFLKQKKSSRFNFLIGVQPNSEANGGKLLLTGDAHLQWQNPFGTGKFFSIQWKGLRPGSPELNLGISFPYLFATHYGLDAGFELYKRDSSYLDVKQRIGASYLFSGANAFKVYLKRNSSSLISIDTANLVLTHELPRQLDTRQLLFGLGYYFENLDYRFNPSKGIESSLNISIGNKKIISNQFIKQLKDPADPGFNFASLYDSIGEATSAILFQYQFSWYQRIAGRWIALTEFRGGLNQNKFLLKNDLFRLGGNTTLKGFDEESLLASQYHIVNIELRYLLGKNAFFHVFANGAYLESKISNQAIQKSWPLGIGSGIAFETKAGIFAINYALGRLDDQHSFQFRNAKIHFGYVNYF